MSFGIQTTEFWLDVALNRTKFVKAFEAHFQGGKAENLPVVPDAKPGYLLFHLHVPLKRKDELAPFLERYARVHSAENKWKPANSHPFSWHS